MKAKRSVLIVGIVALAISFLTFSIGKLTIYAQAEEVSTQAAEVQPTPVRLKVVLQRIYLDGDISEEVVTDTFWSMEDCLTKYDQWQFVGKEGDYLTFQKSMDDISPLLKANGYFGITEEGILTIYNGKPRHSKVIQSFFQIDMGRLESRKRQLLKKGIPIKTKDRYEKVLETYKPYSKMDKQAN